ncbi:lysozyme [Pseudomonas asiatica]|uniref:Lysozyme n=1 Tax=Pseudomonas asiatica TaxID=2219225 RepID=A0AAJ5LKM8_9PSED|nr:lysozyme [Pseudomonas asiatica]UUC20545.1 lysozyme [Pseudomonas asiatica]
MSTLSRNLVVASISATVGIASAVVTHFEGLRTKAYLDPVGIPTVCFGHTATAALGQVKTTTECQQLLETDLAVAIKSVDDLVKVQLPVERRAALVSFVYNVGAGQLAGSTLLRKLNAGDTAGACAEFDRWVFAGGVKLNGLVARRAEERALCEVGL